MKELTPLYSQEAMKMMRYTTLSLCTCSVSTKLYIILILLCKIFLRI